MISNESLLTILHILNIQEKNANEKVSIMDIFFRIRIFKTQKNEILKCFFQITLYLREEIQSITIERRDLSEEKGGDAFLF